MHPVTTCALVRGIDSNHPAAAAEALVPVHKAGIAAEAAGRSLGLRTRAGEGVRPAEVLPSPVRRPIVPAAAAAPGRTDPGEGLEEDIGRTAAEEAALRSPLVVPLALRARRSRHHIHQDRPHRTAAEVEAVAGHHSRRHMAVVKVVAGTDSAADTAAEGSHLQDRPCTGHCSVERTGCTRTAATGVEAQATAPETATCTGSAAGHRGRPWPRGLAS